jgi:hypothetical protein
MVTSSAGKRSFVAGFRQKQIMKLCIVCYVLKIVTIELSLSPLIQKKFETKILILYKNKNHDSNVSLHSFKSLRRVK